MKSTHISLTQPSGSGWDKRSVKKSEHSKTSTVVWLKVPTSVNDWRAYFTDGDTLTDAEVRALRDELAWANYNIKWQDDFRRHGTDPVNYTYPPPKRSRGTRTVEVPYVDLHVYAAMSDQPLSKEAVKVILDSAREVGAKVTGFDILTFDWKELYQQ